MKYFFGAAVAGLAVLAAASLAGDVFPSQQKTVDIAFSTFTVNVSMALNAGAKAGLNQEALRERLIVEMTSTLKKHHPQLDESYRVKLRHKCEAHIKTLIV